jgi:tetratricopeptide (TPR) repeat protein
MTRRGRKRVALVLIAGVLMVPLVLGAYMLRQAQKERLLAEKRQEGMAAYRAHDYDTALTNLAYYVRRRGDDAEAALALADARRRLPIENDKHIITAISLAQQALNASQDKRPALEMLLELYGVAGYLTERLEIADHMLALDPSHETARRVRISCLAAMGRTEQALASAQEMAAKFPDDMEMHRLVLGLMELAGRDRSQMIEYAKGLSDRAPSSMAAAVLKIGAIARFHDRAAAIEMAREAVQLEPESIAVTGEMLRLLDTLSMEEEAAALLEREVASRRLGPGIAVLAAERAWKSGRTAEARQFLAETSMEDDDAAGWAALLEAQESAEPGAAMKALASRNGPIADFWRETVAAQAALTANDPAEARERLRNAVAARPDSLVAEFLMGVAHERVGDWTSAAARWERVVALDPGFRVARIALVNILLRNGRIEEARDQALRAVSARAGLPEVYAVARAFIAAAEIGRDFTGDVQRAVAVLEGIQGRPSSDPIVLPLLARGYMAMGRTAAATAVAQMIIDGKVKPATEDIIALAAAMHRPLPHVAEALLDTAGHLSPGNPEVAYAVALRRAEQGEIAQARQVLQRAINEAPPEAKPAAELQLAAFLDRAGDPNAKAMLARLAAAHPQSARFQLVLLDSQSAWDDQDLVTAAIARLRALAGEGGEVWRFYEARRLLKFDRTPAQAAKAVQHLADLIRIDPNHPGGLTLMADAMLLLDDRAKAIEYLAKVVDSNRGSASLYPSLIQLLREAGQTDAADRRLDEFLRFGDQIPISLRRQRGQLLVLQGRLDDAMLEFEALAQEGSAADKLNLARLCIRRGDSQRAHTLLDELLASPSPDPQAIFTAAEFAALEGDPGRGLALLERLPASMSPEERIAHRAGFLARHGRAAEAERLYTQAAAEGSPRAWADLARFYISQGRYDDADTAVNRGLQAAPNDPDLVRMRGLVRLARGQRLPAGGLADVASLVIGEGDEKTRDRFLEIIRTYEQNPADRERYIASLRRFTETTPTFYPAWYFLVAGLMEQRDVRGAAVAARVAARVMPSDARAARLAVAALTAAGDTREAYEYARQWQERSLGDSFEADCTAAYLLRELGRHGEALDTLRRWTEKIQTGGDAMLDRLELLASLLAHTGAADEANGLLWERAVAKPEAAQAYIRVGMALPDASRRREWLGRAETVAADRPGVRLQLAEAWHMLATETGERSDLERVAAVLGDDPAAYPEPGRAAHILAATHEVLGDTSSAEKYYRTAAKHLPDDPLILNNLAYLLITSGGSAEEALRFAERAVELGGRSALPLEYRASCFDTLGVVLLKLDRYQDALKSFRDGLDLSPTNVALLIGLAHAQAGVGQSTAAAATLSRIRTSGASGLPPSLQKRYEAAQALVEAKAGG